MRLIKDGKYNYYAEQVAQVMAQNELINEEEINEFATFIRGCA